MAKQSIILVLVACFSLMLLAAQPPSDVVPRHPDPKLLRGLTDEEAQKRIKEYYPQQRQEQEAANREYLNVVATEAWKNLLRVTDEQWKLIEPKYEALVTLVPEARVHARAWGGRNQESFHWFRYSKGTDGTRAKTPDEMTEGQKIADALVDLLEDANSTDEQIRGKIDALQQARKNARKALPKAKQELAKVLTTPRQEAVFLIMGCID